MTDLQFAQMREFIVLAEEYAGMISRPSDTSQSEVVEAAVTPPVIVSDLHDLVFKLRNHVSNEGENAMGVEMGMQRAADMIDNLIRRHVEGE